MTKTGYIYILASKRNGTLYIGVTSNLIRRVAEHKRRLAEGFSRRYGIHMLVYYEVCDEIRDAIAREEQLKRWKREWKLDLIEGFNPHWRDLYDGLVG